MIDSILLEYLLAFSQTGSLSKAGELLHLSQPSLSKAMQKLEEEIGVPLFNRSGNHIALNETGQALLPDIQDVVRMLSQIEEKAKSMDAKQCRLNIGMTAPGPFYRFPSLFASQTCRYKVSSSIESEETLLKGLMCNAYDLLFLNRPIEGDHLLCHKVMEERLFLSVPKGHFLSRFPGGIHFHEADGQTFLVISNTGVWMDVLKKEMSHSRFLLQDDPDALKEIVEASSIPSFVTDLTLSSHLAENRVAIPFLDASACIPFFVVSKESRAELFHKLVAESNS